MQDQRTVRRRHLIFYMRVFNYQTQQILGYVADISWDGLMLVSEEPIALQQTYQLAMRLPSSLSDTPEDWVIEATSKWSRNDVNPMFYDTGFHIAKADKAHIMQVESLIRTYGFNE